MGSAQAGAAAAVKNAGTFSPFFCERDAKSQLVQLFFISPGSLIRRLALRRLALRRLVFRGRDPLPRPRSWHVRPQRREKAAR